MRIAVRLLVLVFVVVLGSAAEAGARGASFALKPVGHAELGYFRYDGAPGARLKGAVRVVNVGDRPGTAELGAVDATTGATTGAVYEDLAQRPEDLGAWLALGSTSVALAPGEDRVVPFTVDVPADARRGEHLGGIVARPASARSAAGDGGREHSFRVDVVDQSIVAVQVDLPGPARALLALRGVEAGGNPGYQTLLLSISNPGERMARGKGTVVVRSGGRVVWRETFAVDTFLPRTRIEYPLVVRKTPLVPGDYTAEVTLEVAGGARTTSELPFALTAKDVEQAYGSDGLPTLPGARRAEEGGSPVALLGGAAGLLALLGFGVMFTRLRRRTRELERRLGAVAPPEGGEVTVSDARERVPSGE